MRAISRKWADHAFDVLVWGAALGVAAVLAWMLGDLLVRGAGRLDGAFLVGQASDAGRAGGIASVLVSTLLILGIALAAAVPLGIGSAIWLAELTRHDGKAGAAIRIGLDALAGVPSIVFGLFGSAFFCVFLDLGYSIMAGGLTLACMILPILIRSSEAGLRAVRQDWRRGAAAVGLSRFATVWHLLLPAAGPAIGAGLVLSIGRALAESAALIFTSGYADRMPESLLDSGRALSVHIYDLSMNVGGGDASAYGTALVLVSLIAVANTGAHFLVQRIFSARIVIA